MAVQIGTHPDNLCIQCGEVVGHLGKFGLNILFGEAKRYRPILTIDKPEFFTDTREEQLERLKTLLINSALQARYHGQVPKTAEEFILNSRAAGFTTDMADDAYLRKSFEVHSETGNIGILTAVIDPDRCMDGHMIEEIMERFVNQPVVDTSQDPLKTFVGAPTC